MSANNHTPIQTGAAANSSTINAPLGQLDAAMGDLDTLTTTQKTDLVAAVNELVAGKQNNPSSQSANQVYASPNGASGTPGFRALVNNDLPASGVTAGTHTKVTVNSKGVVTGSSSLQASDISDLTSTPVDTLGAPTDVTTNNATTSRHGFLPKLANDAMQFLNGIGNWVKWACGIKYNSSGAYTPRSYINFKGAGVTVQDNAAADSVDVTISGIAGGQQALSTLTDVSIVDPQLNQVPAYNPSSQLWENKNISSFVPTGHVVQDEGINLTNRPSLNFTGNGVAATDNTGSNRTDVTVTVPVKASGAEITTGTDDDKFATPAALSAAGITGAEASATVKGKIELATAAETTTGTDDTRAVTPDGLAGSDYGKRVVEVLVNGSIALTTNDKAYFRIPSVINNWNLVGVAAMCKDASSSGAVTITVKKGSTSMLSTNLTIDQGEYDSSTAATAAVIDTSQDDVTTGQQIEVAVTEAGTGVKYAVVELIFQAP